MRAKLVIMRVKLLMMRTSEGKSGLSVMAECNIMDEGPRGCCADCIQAVAEV